MSGNTTKRRRRSQGYRTTINPSKRHRDRLNQELENLSKLLPFPEEVIARLDKLSVLRLSVSFLRNKNFLKGVPKRNKEVIPPVALPSPKGIFSQLFNEAIDGFMIIVTYSGVIFYVSDSVKSHLGYAQSQYLHQSLFSYIHDDDHEELRNGLEEHRTQKIVEIIDDDDGMADNDDVEKEIQPREFVLRMKSILNSSSSDMYKPYKVTGYMRKLNYMLEKGPDQYGLFAVCTPARPSCSMLEIRMKSTLFCSKNKLDLTFLDMDARGKDFFGYSKKDLFGRSSYVMVHRTDLQHLRCKHTEIIHLGRTTMATFRLLSKSNDWTWICGYARVIYKNHKEEFVVTTNRLMSEEEGDAVLQIRDSEDVKSLHRIGLSRDSLREDECMKLGFPLESAYDFSAIEAGPMPKFHANSDAVIVGTINNQHEHKIITDDLMKENPEELFDVSEDLLKSSPENILGSPEDFSDAFDMSPETLQDPGYSLNLGQDNTARLLIEPTTCASARSESLSTMSDISVEQQMLAQYQRQQSSGSSASPCRPEGPLDQSREAKKNSLTSLAKSLNELGVSCPPNVLAPPTDSNPYLQMSLMAESMGNLGSRQTSPPQGQGHSITDLSYSSPQQRGYSAMEGYMPNGGYYPPAPNTVIDFSEFKQPKTSYRVNTRPNTIQYINNSMPSPQNTYANNYTTVTTKPPPSPMHFTQYSMERPPNVTITAPESNLQDLRAATVTISANGRSESSPKYPFTSPVSPTLSWSNSQNPVLNDVGMDNIEQMTLPAYNGMQSSQHQIYSMTRQLMNMQHQQQQQQQQQQPQQQQPRQNGFPSQYYS